MSTFINNSCFFTSEALESEWEQIKMLKIEEKTNSIDFIQCLFQWTGLCGLCESSKIYNILTYDNKNDCNKQLGQVKESTNCLELMCCLQLRKTSFMFQYDTDITYAKKSRHCPFYTYCNCIDNGEMDIQVSSSYVGSIKGSNSCERNKCLKCQYIDLEIVNRVGYKELGIHGNPCQKSKLFRDCYLICLRKTYNEIEFDILDEKDQRIGIIKHIFQNSCQQIFTKADTFIVEFPAQISVSLKVQLLFATIFIDFLDFQSPCLNLP